MLYMILYIIDLHNIVNYISINLKKNPYSLTHITSLPSPPIISLTQQPVMSYYPSSPDTFQSKAYCYGANRMKIDWVVISYMGNFG